MNNNNFILFGLLIIIFALLFYKQSGNNYDNNYLNTLDNIRMKNKLNHKLNNEFNISNNHKISLNGKKVEKYFNKNTLDDDFKLSIIELIHVILKHSNKMNNLQHYNIKEIHELYQQIDMNRNQRYLVHFFIYGVKTYTTKKLLVDFVIINSELYINYIGEDISSIYGMVDKYDMKISQAVQNMKKPYTFGYLNNKNATQIIDEFYRLQKLNVIEYDKSINEYPDYISKLNGVYKTDISDLINKFLPLDTPSVNNPSFCEKFDSSKWDARGINFQKDDCVNNNNTNSYKPNIPRDSPDTNLYSRSYTGQFSNQLQRVGYDTGGYNIPTTSY